MRTLAEAKAIHTGRPKFSNALLTRIFDSDDTQDVEKIGTPIFMACLLEYEAGALTKAQMSNILGLTTQQNRIANRILTAIDNGQVTHATLRAVFILAEVGIYEQADVIARLRAA